MTLNRRLKRLARRWWYLSALLSLLLTRILGHLSILKPTLRLTADNPEEIPNMPAPTPHPTTTLTTNQRTTVRISGATDRRGHPAEVQGVTAWYAVPDGSMFLEPSADELSCRVTPALSFSGSCVVYAEADADISEGVVTITTGWPFVIGHELATALVGTVDTPEDIPEEAGGQAGGEPSTGTDALLETPIELPGEPGLPLTPGPLEPGTPIELPPGDLPPSEGEG